MPEQMKHLVIVSLVLTLLCGGGWLGWRYYSAHQSLESTDDAYVQADVVPLKSQVAGRIAQVLVSENEVVHENDPLVQIDPTDFKARLDQARAGLAVAKAKVTDISQQLRLQNRKIAEAKARVQAAKATVQRRELDAHRAQRLAQKGYGSKQQLQDMTADASVALAQLKQALANCAAQRKMVDVLRAQQDSARAQVESARAEVEFSRSQLAKTLIRAPRGGVVGDLGARVGASSDPAQTLLRLIPVSALYVVANYKETQVAHISIGQPVTLRVDAYPGKTFHGVVSSLAPATGAQFSLLPPDNATGNFNKIVQRVPVRIRLTEPAKQLAGLRPGMSVVPTIDTRSPGSGLSYLVPPSDRAQFVAQTRQR